MRAAHVDMIRQILECCMEVLHNSCNIGTRALPDMYALALGHRAYISGNALMPMLQLLNVIP